MERILIITPHLSTGGLPQYLLNKIQKTRKSIEIFVVEWQDITGGVFVVQRNKIKDLLGDRLITLGENKIEILDCISQLRPDLVHFEELPETFVDASILDSIFNTNRNYKIACTTHSSDSNPASIKYIPDSFILVSEWSKNVFSSYFKNVDCQVLEYEIEPVEYDKREAKLQLGFDPEYKHVLHVGLFTPGKNQRQLVEIARLMRKYKIIFHFVGNQAENFKEYWSPIMANFPDNCVWHGERSDVELFYKAADIFYFPSLFELNPLAVKEAVAYGLPVFIRPLKTISLEGFNLITDNIQVNKNKLLDFFGESIQHSAVTLVLSHANNPGRKKLLHECLDSIKTPVILSSNYPVEADEQKKCDWVLYSQDNPLLHQEEFAEHNLLFHRWEINEQGERVITDIFKFEHSYAFYQLVKNGLLLAKNLGKNKIQIINYDYVIQEQEQRSNLELLEKRDLIFYEYENYGDYGKNSWCTGYFLGKIDPLLKFFNCYDNRLDFYKNPDIFEVKIRDYYMPKLYDLYIKSYEQLKQTGSLVDREGAGLFSKTKGTEQAANFYLNHSYMDGPKIEITGDGYQEFEITFKDSYKNIIYTSVIKTGMWSALNNKYYKKVSAEIRKDGELIHTEHFDLKGANVLITIDSRSLGDTLAWFPYAEEFRKKHGCNMYVCTFMNHIFKNQYPDLNFIEPSENIQGLYAMFRIGWYNDKNGPDYNRNPGDFKIGPLQKTASDILGLEYKEIRPVLNIPVVKKKKKVGLGIHSTAQAKYWNNATGWQEITDWLISNGYEVVIYSREEDGYMGNRNPRGAKRFEGSLQDIINDMSECEYFIGIGSGLSWLAWAVNVPVYLISGFSDTFAEMQDCIRIINRSVCHGCFNRHIFDPGDWNWCPDHKGTDRQFECSRSITAADVIKTIEKNSQQGSLNISAFHLLTKPEDEREQRSIESISRLANFDINYQQCINQEYTELPPSENCKYPEKISLTPGGKLTPAHYGCYLAHKSAFEQAVNTDSDVVLIFECDAVIDIPVEDFIEKVKTAYTILKETDLFMFSFGYHNNRISETRNGYLITGGMIGAQAYLIPKKSFAHLKKIYDTCKWDVTDLFFCENLADKKIGMFNQPVVLQGAGYSLLDKAVTFDRF